MRYSLLILFVSSLAAGCDGTSVESPPPRERDAALERALVGVYESPDGLLRLELKRNRRFRASQTHWSSSYGCFLVESGTARGEWSARSDFVEFHEVRAAGDLVQVFDRLRIEGAGAALEYSSTVDLLRRENPNTIVRVRLEEPTRPDRKR